MLPASPSRSDGEGDRRRRWRGDMALTQSSVTPPPASLVPLPILRMGRQSGRAKIRRQEPRVDPGALEPRGPAAVDVAVVEERVAARGCEPAVAAQLLLELARAPAGIAKRGDPALRAASGGDGAEDVEGGGQGPAAGDVDALLPAPFRRVEEEAAGRLDGSAMMDRNVGREAGIDVHLAKKLVEGEPRNDPPQADAERAILVMDAHRDHRLLEARVADARHCQEELADEISRVFHRRPL